MSFSEPIADFKSGECEGERCPYFSGMVCDAELELVDYSGKGRGHGLPAEDATSYALYVRRCTGEDIRYVDIEAVSPNGLMGPTELAWRRNQFITKHGLSQLS